MNNLDKTIEIFTNNIIGSFILILERKPDNKEPVDFISDMRVSCYHHLIVKEGNDYSYPDMMDRFNYEPYDTCFTYIDDKYKNEEDYFICDDEMPKGCDLDKEAKKYVDKFIKIFSNKGLSLAYLKDPLLGKIAGYKAYCMKGIDVSIYHAKCLGNKITDFRLVFDEDVLGNFRLQEDFIKYFKRAL